MNYEQKPGAGALFKNKNKKSEKHPDMTGNIILPDGTQMQIAAWKKVSKNGLEFLSLSLSEAREQKEEIIF